MSKRSLIMIGAAVLNSATLLAQVPRGYEIVQVTDTPEIEFRPRFNGAGQCVFTAWDFGSRQTQEIHLYDLRTGVTMQLTDNGLTDGFPDINDAGVIVWHSGVGPVLPGETEPSYEIMMRTPDGNVTRLTDNDFHDTNPSINNGGQIVWNRYGDEPALWWDIVMLDTDGSLVQISEPAPPGSGISDQGPHLNDLGQVAWTRYFFSAHDRVAVLYSGGERTELPDTLQYSGTYDLNNQSQVLWRAYDDEIDDHVLRLWDAGQITTLAGGGVAASAINDLGDVVLTRKPGNQVWLLRDQRVYQLTDGPLDNWYPAINNRSELAWVRVDLPNGDLFVLRRFANGNLNCDGVVDAFDIEPFLMSLLDPGKYDALYPACDPLQADMNGDGNVDSLDVEPFVAALLE